MSGESEEVPAAAAAATPPLEWKFAQVFGERVAGEEVHDGMISASLFLIFQILSSLLRLISKLFRAGHDWFCVELEIELLNWICNCCLCGIVGLFVLGCTDMQWREECMTQVGRIACLKLESVTDFLLVTWYVSFCAVSCMRSSVICS